MKKIPERFTWAAGIMAAQPADNILEIGCGAGILAEQIAAHLSTGSVTAIDKSEAMLRLAANRNSQFVQAGKVKLQHGPFAKPAPAQAHAFDKVVAFNVNFFWKDQAAELQTLPEWLKPQGQLFVFWQFPYEPIQNPLQPISSNLLRNGFLVSQTLQKKCASGTVFCVVAQPAGQR